MQKSKKIFVIIMVGILVMSIPQQTIARQRGNYGRAKVIRVSTLPMGYRTFNFGRTKYFMSSGIYYKRSLTGYHIVAAPIGLCINSLPIGFQIVYFNNLQYFYYKDTYYQYDPSRSVYIVVEKPIEEK